MATFWPDGRASAHDPIEPSNSSLVASDQGRHGGLDRDLGVISYREASRWCEATRCGRVIGAVAGEPGCDWRAAVGRWRDPVVVACHLLQSGIWGEKRRATEPKVSGLNP